MDLFLGIDLGTTTVKVALIDEDKKTFVERDKAHEAFLIPSQKGTGGGAADRHEQCPKKIVRTVLELLDEFDSDSLAKLKSIAISGQMHGVLLWEADPMGFDVGNGNCSPLITWMDTRCDQRFLQKLPKWTDGKNPLKEKRIATGYGMATLAWLKEHGKLDGQKWDSAGTIMDFLVSCLTQSKNVCISTQNAESWGYLSGYKWTIQESSDVFPTHLLPTIVRPGTVVGHTSLPLTKLPRGVPVLVALGDLQASLLPFLGKGEAALHIGTASQIAFVSEEEAAEEATSTVALPDSVRCDPFFDGNFLLVAPSLNGGNVFECFFRQIASWSAKLFGLPIELEKCSSPCTASSMLDHVLNSTATQSSSDIGTSLTVMPTFYGERHIPATEGGAVVKNWRMDTSIEQFVLSISRGIVANLAQMMPPAILEAHSVHKLKLIGRANQKAFAEEAKRQFPDLQIVFGEEQHFSAAYGAALHAARIFMENK
ncbi:hypothetical protein GPALN_001891 [Globodera pallida]|nr:hypothetical protein GPALN_001891 [Globodera pallida]